LHEAAGLEDAGDRPGLEAAQFGVGIAEQALAKGVRAHAVRAGDAQPARGHEIAEPFAPRLRFRLLAVAHHRGVDGGRRDAGFLRVGEHGGDRRGRHDHQRMIDRLGKIPQRDMATLAVDLALPRIDQGDAAAIAELAQVLVDLARPAGALGRAHDGNGLRLQRADGRTE
jgi:hypothetical protein